MAATSLHAKSPVYDPHIKGNQIKLRPPGSYDKEAYYHLFANTKALQIYPEKGPFTKQWVDKTIQTWTTEKDKSTFPFSFVVEEFSFCKPIAHLEVRATSLSTKIEIIFISSSGEIKEHILEIAKAVHELMQRIIKHVNSKLTTIELKTQKNTPILLLAEALSKLYVEIKIEDGGYELDLLHEKTPERLVFE